MKTGSRQVWGRGNGSFRNIISLKGHSHICQEKVLNNGLRTSSEGPFGEVIRSSGSLAKVNSFRFSTKYQDDETELLYYGFRYLSSYDGRWANRDPMEEDGGANLYSCLGNNVLTGQDFLGLVIVCCSPQAYFDGLGLKDKYVADGDTYSSKAGEGVPDGGDREIVWKMLRSTRKFTVKRRDVNQLMLHVKARSKVVLATGQVSWGFGSDRGYNSAYWSSMYETKANAAAAVYDMFRPTAAEDYTRACHSTAKMVIIKGVLDTIGAGAFNQMVGGGGSFLEAKAYNTGLIMSHDVAPQYEDMPSQDWVPGDVGYVRGHNATNRLFAGEWIVDVGNSTYWGFDRKPHRITLSKWIQLVKDWRDDAAFVVYVDKVRLFPGVGLE